MNKTEVLKLNDQVIDAWNRHDADKFMNLCDENVIWKINGGNEIYRGKKEVKEYFNRWKTAFPDLHLDLNSKLADTDIITAEFEFTGTQDGKLMLNDDMPEIEATHRKVDTHGSFVSKLKNGKLVETNLYTDRLTLIEQLGVTNAMPHHN
jgi:steroid delta-isomerase-like uncharacterized protein